MNASVEFKPTTRRGSPPPTLILGLLLLSVLLMAGAFGYGAYVAKNNHRYISLTAEQRVMTLEMAKYAAEASRGEISTFPVLQNASQLFETALDQLINGDSRSNLPPSPADVGAALNQLSRQWPNFSDKIDLILREEGVIRMLSEFVSVVNKVIPDLSEQNEEVISILLTAGAKPDDVYIATRQLMLGQRIASNINLLVQDGSQIEAVQKALKADTEAYSSVLTGLQKGDRTLGINRVSNTKARAKLEQIQADFQTLEEVVLRVLDKAPQLVITHNAAKSIFIEAQSLIANINHLTDSYKDLDEKKKKLTWLGYGLGLVALLLLLWLGHSLLYSSRYQMLRESDANRRTQSAILQLLDEISPLAQGDLTVHANVTKEMTGAIADAINYAVDALRQLVHAINDISKQVADTAEETQATAIHLTNASDKQAQHIHSVSQSVEDISDAIARISSNAEQSASVARNSVNLAEQGALAVKNTIKGMSTIREDIRETANRIKRLGESSQEIGDIIELINDIADQTNILALNAAIQASSAEQGDGGFSLVADEVQQLAERVGQSTQRIETLVRTIQLDTGKAVVAMEQSTTDVLKGARLAEAAGDALMRIEAVSTHLASLIHNISVAAGQLKHTADEVSRDMITIRRVTHQSVAGTKQTTNLTGKLAAMAIEQKDLVSGFRLPGIERNTPKSKIKGAERAST